jgi:hypothetical protein
MLAVCLQHTCSMRMSQAGFMVLHTNTCVCRQPQTTLSRTLTPRRRQPRNSADQLQKTLPTYTMDRPRQLCVPLKCGMCRNMDTRSNLGASFAIYFGWQKRQRCQARRQHPP